MSEWRKVINSGSQAELESLHIDGETSITTTEDVYGPEQNFYVHQGFDQWVNGASNGAAWTTLATHSNDSGTPWIVNSGSIIEGFHGDGISTEDTDAYGLYTMHYPFEIHNGGNNGGNTGTGPDGGIVWGGPGADSTKAISYSGVDAWLHADTSAITSYTPEAGGITGVFSLVSPRIELTENHYSNPKLIFYQHMYSSNNMMGNLKVFRCSSATQLGSATLLPLTYYDGTAVMATGTVISGNQQTNQTDPYRRVEVDLSSLSTSSAEYIWIIYKGGGSSRGDCALGHIYLQAPEAPQSVTTTTNPPVALQVNASDIKFHNLPTSDPETQGQLWKDNLGGNGALSYIRVSAGPP